VLILVNQMSHPLNEMAFSFLRIAFNPANFIFYVMLLISGIVGCSSSSRTVSSASPDIKIDSSFEVNPASQLDKPEIEQTIDKIDEETSKDSISSISLKENNPTIDRHKMLDNIMRLAGTRYKFNGIDSTGIDCSGYTAKIFLNTLGIELPRSSEEQYSIGVKVERDSLIFGDLVFFAMHGKSPSHVGIYVSDGLFAHASVSIGVTISILESEYYKRRYLGARRIVE